MFEELTFSQLLLVLIGAAVGVGLLVTALVYAGGSRGSKRYRPGRPFVFRPVWFVSAPERQARSGRVAPAARSKLESRNGTALTAAPAQRASHPGQTGGASDRW